jgi:hypothetical protein
MVEMWTDLVSFFPEMSKSKMDVICPKVENKLLKCTDHFITFSNNNFYGSNADIIFKACYYIENWSLSEKNDDLSEELPNFC